MIQNERQLQQAIEQIQNLCRALESLRADLFPKNPRNFAVLAEGPLAESRKLQGAIGEYVRQPEGTVRRVAEKRSIPIWRFLVSPSPT
jgi:hypothetical protein